MQIKYQGNAPVQIQFFYEKDKNIPASLAKSGFFNGKSGEIFSEIQEEKLLAYVGLGKKEKCDAFSFLKAGISVSKSILKKSQAKLAQILEGPISEEYFFFLAEGILLEQLYSYSLKKEQKAPSIQEIIIPQKYKGVMERAEKVAASRNLVRELVDTPSNTLTTTEFAHRLEEKFSGMEHVVVEVWNQEKLIAENLQGLLHVGKGSVYPPYLVKISYSPENAKKTLNLVGKGITFDSGGLSLKPSDAMLDMKGDMAGAATVAGVLDAAIACELPVKINAFFAIAENSISERAYKVSDVISYRNGKSVEIANTDAEGRLVMADALIMSGDEKADLLIDMATLTGACMVALGTDYYGVFSNNDKVAGKYCAFTKKKTSEKAWHMPLEEKYKEQMKSKIADIKNIGKRWGGAITAALFLNEFVPEKQEWMHFDIAGPFFDEGLGLFAGMATGVPLESLFLYLQNEFLKS